MGTWQGCVLLSEKDFIFVTSHSHQPDEADGGFSWPAQAACRSGMKLFVLDDGRKTLLFETR
jgi:hypothetical protein